MKVEIDELKIMIEVAKEAGLLAKKLKPFVHNISKNIDKNTISEEIYLSKSALTEADLKVQDYIISRLSYKLDKKGNTYGFIAEENTELKKRFRNHLKKNKKTFIIDPIDGTKNYSEKKKIYATMIALADGFKIIAGVIFFPELNILIDVKKNTGTRINNKKFILSEKLKNKKFFINDKIRISSSLPKTKKSFFNQDNYYCIAYTCYKLLTGDFISYMSKKADLVDINCIPLIYQEAKGYFSGINLEKIDDKKNYTVNQVMIFAPNKDYCKKMKYYLKE